MVEMLDTALQLLGPDTELLTEILLDLGGEDPGLGFCELDLSRISEVREQIPSLANRRKIPN